jgi:hypothetical protein
LFETSQTIDLGAVTMPWITFGLILSGVAVLFGGLGLVLSPKLLIMLNEKFSSEKISRSSFITDDQILSKRYTFGIIFIIVSLFLFYSGWRII